MPSSSLKRFFSAAARFIDGRPHATAAALAALAFVAHLHFFVFSAASHERWDSAQYIACARNLAAGRGFLDASGVIEARRTPAYPAFLALFAPLHFNETGIVIVQHLCAVLLVVAVFYAARALIGDSVVAAVAAALLAVDSGQIYMADVVMAETMMSITLFAAVTLCGAASLRGDTAGDGGAGKLASSGLLTGLTVLVRPIAMYLWFPLALWCAIFCRRRVVAVLVFLVSAWSLPGLWIWRNYERAGVASLSSIQGEILYYWRAAGVVAIESSGFEYSPLPFSGEDRFRYEFFRVAQHEFARNADRMLGARAKTMTEAQISDFEGQVGRTILREHPRSFVLLTIYGALHLIFDNTWDYASAITGGFSRVALIWWLYIVSVASFVLAIIGFFRLLSVNAPFAWLLAITLIYFVAVSSGPEHEQWRYRVPMIPLYSILIACCIIRPHAGLLRTENR